MSAEKLRMLNATIKQAVHQMNSLDELGSWLQSQSFIEFVRLEDYVVKTFPPRREFTIGLRMGGGIIFKEVLTVVTPKDNQVEFHELRE